MDTYITLKDFLEANGDWKTLQLLDGVSLDQQAAKLRHLFYVLTSDRSDLLRDSNAVDISASECVRLLLHAVSDGVLIPATQEGPHGNRVYQWSNAWEDRLTNAQDQRASEVIHIWGAIKDADKNNPHTPILMKTKHAMLTEVATAWCETKDEERANVFFDFLIDVVSVHAWEEERKMRLDVIQKATDLHFPVLRLRRHLLAIASRADNFETKHPEVFRKLAIALARNSETKDFASMLWVAEPVAGCSEGALDIVHEHAVNRGKLDAKAHEILQSMQPGGFGHRLPEGLVGIPGEIRLDYDSGNPMVVEVTILHELAFEHLDDSYGHIVFEAARDHITRWKQKYPKYQVVLKLIVTERPTDEVKFRREQVL